MNRYTGKTVWITGAETPLGRKAAEMFLGEGARLLVSGVKDFPGSEVICYEHNPINEEHANKALSLINTLDILVVANRYVKRSAILESTAELFDEVIDQNLSHAWCAARGAAGKMGKKRGGVILFISSIHGEKPSASTPLYSIACGGVNMLMKEASLDFGRLGIRVNQLRCGFLEGDAELFISQVTGLYHNPEFRIPRGYPGKLEEAASAALFLCSNEASFINGATLNADGGTLGFYAYADSGERWDFGYGGEKP